MFLETQSRSFAKALSWRILGTLATSALVFVATRKLVLSLAVGGVEFVSKIGLFWVHERVWNRLRYGRRLVEPTVIWFTGLSGAGKSAIAERVARDLGSRGLRVEHLDGENVRQLFPETGFTAPERDAHIRRVGLLASMLGKNGTFVVASFVSPYEVSRQFVRSLCPQFLEVYVATPLEVCEARDEKGLYARARRGEIRHFTGIDDPYEPPARPDLVVDTRATTPDDAAAAVITELGRRGNLG